MTNRKSELLDHAKLKRDVAATRAAGLTGSWNDGGGLKLVLTKAGKARFVHRYSHRGRTPEHWFKGEFPDGIGLAEARRLRNIDKALVAAGKDPLTVGEEALEVPTVAEYARRSFEKLAPPGERHDPRTSQWLRDMTHRIGAVAKLRVNDVRLTDVANALACYWDGERATPSAERMVGRLVRLLDRWHVQEQPDSDWVNPISMRRLKQRLGDARHYIRNRPSLRFEDAPAFMAELRAMDTMAARLAEFTILAGVRPVEAREAKWQEIDWSRRQWVIPAARMKTQKGKGEFGRDHIVPLSLGMVRCLRRAARCLPCRAENYIFPSLTRWRGERPAVAANALTAKPARDVVRTLRPGCTLHGWRSTLVSWGVAIPHRRLPPFGLDVMDKCLAHEKINAHSDVSSAMRHYAHHAGGDPYLARRKQVQREWSVYLDGRTLPAPAAAVPTPATVVQLPLAA